jgi:membrane protein YqaA with SNARE-associated domain
VVQIKQFNVLAVQWWTMRSAGSENIRKYAYRWTNPAKPLQLRMTAWLETALPALLAALALPRVGLPAVFVWCVVSATLLPLGSEPAVFGYIKLNPDMFVWGILVATAGNTLGGMINYWLAFGAKRVVSGGVLGAAPLGAAATSAAAHQTSQTKPSSQDKYTARALRWFEKLGPKALFFSFLPGIGDPLTAVAGWLKMPWLPCLCWQAAGKLLRYLVMTAALLYVPDHWWSALFAPFKAVFHTLF